MPGWAGWVLTQLRASLAPGGSSQHMRGVEVLSPASHRPSLSSLEGITAVGALTCPWSFPFPSLPRGASSSTDEAWLLVQAWRASLRRQARPHPRHVHEGRSPVLPRRVLRCCERVAIPAGCCRRHCAGRFGLQSGRHADCRWVEAGRRCSAPLGAGRLGEGPGRLRGKLLCGWGEGPSDHTGGEVGRQAVSGAAATLGVWPRVQGCSSRLSGPVTCAARPGPLASPGARISHVTPSAVPPWRLGVGGHARGHPVGAALRPRPVRQEPPSQASCLLGPSLVDPPPMSSRGLRMQFQGAGGRGGGHVVELGRALGTPSSLTAPSPVSPRAASPSRPSTTSPSPRSMRPSWWTLRRWAAGGPAWPVAGRAAAASPLGPVWGPGAWQSCRALRRRRPPEPLALSSTPCAPGHRPLRAVCRLLQRRGVQQVPGRPLPAPVPGEGPGPRHH